MRKALTIVVLAVAATTAVAQAATRVHHANSTAYCGGGLMSDGTNTRARSAAVIEGTHPLGTKIRITGKQAGPGGLRKWTVRDHIGSGSKLDFWVDGCGKADTWGRRNVTYKMGWGKPRK